MMTLWIVVVYNLIQDLHPGMNVPAPDTFVDLQAVNSLPDNLNMCSANSVLHPGFCMNLRQIVEQFVRPCPGNLKLYSAKAVVFSGC